MNRDSPFVILDDARLGHERQVLFKNPVRVIAVTDPDRIPSALREIDNAVRDGFFAAGYFSYELGYFLEPRLCPIAPKVRDVPLLWFALFREKEVFSGEECEHWLKEHIKGRAYAGPLHLSLDEKSYDEKFGRAQEYVRAGDVYQINLTFPGHFRFCGDPLAFYARLRMSSRAGNGAFIFDGAKSILSLSPELFFARKKDKITSKPMKGTAPRAHQSDSDENLRSGLASSEKDRAENLMIVDLIRNDLGRLAKIGSVRAHDLFAIESYPTVHQMVSSISADLSNDVTTEELIHAVFPCGSITGAPKIRAMEIIRELESTPRGVYCGSIGVFSPDQTSSFNVAIRTITLSENYGTLGIGSAVVADSASEVEYEECLLKARYFTDVQSPIGLIETLRYEPNHGFLRGELHLARLEASAERLDIPFDKAGVRKSLDAAVHQSNAALRMRLQLSGDGSLEVTTRPFSPQTPDNVWKYVVSEHFVQSEDLLARHKTSWRDLYDSERARWSACGIDEVIFQNERGELAEASTTNIFVLNGRRLQTPPLSSGALEGCLRRSLLDSGECEERVLRLEDLERSEALFFGNSLRGLIRGERAQ
jgi:para-aminobenzoate synthetase/4-amino-4-deoxychorismate lyase